jgi:hypothetical protein
VAVGDVMHQLPDGPPAFAIWRVDLGFGQAVDGGTKIFRQGGQSGNRTVEVLGIDNGRADEVSDRIARIGSRLGRHAIENSTLKWRCARERQTVVEHPRRGLRVVVIVMGVVVMVMRLGER